jgi:hypothetical protein
MSKATYGPAVGAITRDHIETWVADKPFFCWCIRAACDGRLDPRTPEFVAQYDAARRRAGAAGVDGGSGG